MEPILYIEYLENHAFDIVASDRVKEYIRKELRKTTVSHLFLFENWDQYYNFETMLLMKFDVSGNIRITTENKSC